MRFARPFVNGFNDKSPKFSDLFSRHLSPAYYATQLCRVGDLAATDSLAGERGHSVAAAAAALLQPPGAADPLGPGSPPAAAPLSAWVHGRVGGWLVDSPAPSPPNTNGAGAASPAAAAAAPLPPSFMADVFFLTLKWIHVGLMPCLYRYQRLSEVLVQAGGQQEGAAADKAAAVKAAHSQALLLRCCTQAMLLEPTFVEDSVQFCLLTVSWLVHCCAAPPAVSPASCGLALGGAAALRLVPAWVLGDAVAWLTYIVHSGLAVHVASKDVGALTAGLVALLERPDCVASVLLHDKLARLLLAMLGPHLSVTQRAAKTGSLATAPSRPGDAALVASVLNSPAVASGAMAAALMRAYVRADHVVGLDVDRDAFDKFSMRSTIDMILEELWQDPRGRRQIVALAQAASPSSTSPSPSSSPSPPASSSAVFYDYATCLFNSLIYLFKDSLDRLVDISQVEAAQADQAAWMARPATERQQQEAFVRATAATCRGFMRMATASLAWLNALTEDPQAGAAFCRPPLAGRVAYSLLHFTEVLASDRAAQLVVAQPEQYGWDRGQLLASCLGLLLRLSASPGGPSFRQALAAEPDLDLALLAKAQEQLEASHRVMAASQLAALLASLPRPSAPTSPPLAAPAALTPGGPAPPQATQTPPAKRSRPSSDEGVGPGPDGGAGSQAMAVEGAAGGAAGGAAASLIASLPPLGPPDLSGAELAAAYSQALGPLALATFDSTAPRAYHSAFAAMAANPGSAPPAKMKRLTRELRDLGGRTALPCGPEAAIFLRYDADQVDRMRALITGPASTPYAYGCFCFDLLFPPAYPNTAMLINFETTGQGRARFNPNLYADGKVCLSLINTWHASHDSEKWNPQLTTTWQVLVSIQGMILVEDPYFNEPAHEATRGTDTGLKSAARYNAELTLNTLRWAIIDKLRHPPPGFQEVVANHFRLTRHKVLAAAAGWAAAAAETGDALLEKRTDAAVRELHALLAAL
ncbi:ubiquitin elongating factor core-domain-containing protein [Haematococcus lacustris]